MRQIVLACCVVTMCVFSGGASDAGVIYPRQPAPSPDGGRVAFSYQGDIWIVAAEGGAARRVTAHPAYDGYPVWSPDGENLAFASRRDGNFDVFTIPVDDGEVSRLTFYSESDLPTDWTPDGEAVLFHSRREIRDMWNMGMYRIPAAGGTPSPVLPTGGRQVVTSHDGGRIAYVRGSNFWWRRGYEGSGRYRLWLHDAATDSYVNLSELGPGEEPGVNSHPAWFPDGVHVLYLSEMGGVSNLRILSVEDGSRIDLTSFTDGRMSFPKLSRDGSLAAFEYEGDIYTVPVPRPLPGPGEPWPEGVPQPARLEIRLPRDEVLPWIERINATSGADEIAVSPDGEQIAFVHRGDIFAMKASTEEPWALRLTSTAAREHRLSWTPDGEALVFVSDESGQQDIYSMRSTDEDDPRLARSLEREVTRLTDDPAEDAYPRVSPDGERIAFVRGTGTLVTMRSDGSDERTLLEGWSSIDFDWSPDSEWIVYARDDDEFNSDVWIVSADGREGPHNVSRHPDNDGRPVWSADGRVIAFTSQRAYSNQTDIWYVWLSLADEERSKQDVLDEEDRRKAASVDEDDEDKDKNNDKDVEVVIDFEDIHERLHQVTSFPGEESRVLVGGDSKEFFFTSNTDGKVDLWKVRWDGSELERLTEGGHNPRFLQWADDETIFYLKSGGRPASIEADGSNGETYSFEARMTVDLKAERAQMFDEAWRALRDNFYDEDFHGADWTAMREKYRPWALAASTAEDFRDAVRLMLGELNSSHQQLYAPESDDPGAQTGELGVVFDPAHEGGGVRVLRVTADTPADRVTSRLHAGDVITAINGETIAQGDNVYRFLDGTVDRKTVLRVRRASGGDEDVVIRPISTRDFRRRVYEEVVDTRREFVAGASNGAVAYIHVQGMNLPSLELFERDLYAEAHGKEALIIDVRNNGGGWTTDYMLSILLAGDHAVTVPRGGGRGYPQDRRLLYAWPKPVVVLCNENSFSNAEIFAWSIRTLKRGPVVGRQTFGGVISTGARWLVDGSRVRIPFRGWYSKLDGSNMEGVGCMPDVVVENLPGDLGAGRDAQLEKAVELALDQAGQRP